MSEHTHVQQTKLVLLSNHLQSKGHDIMTQLLACRTAFAESVLVTDITDIPASCETSWPPFLVLCPQAISISNTSINFAVTKSDYYEHTGSAVATMILDH